MSEPEERSGAWTLAVGLAAPALRKLGLPESDWNTFAAAFCQGMTAPVRARALGDMGHPGWAWGYGDREADDVARHHFATAESPRGVGARFVLRLPVPPDAIGPARPLAVAVLRD